MDAIREWLKGNMDYNAGAKLYLIHGTDPALKRVFSEAASPFKKRMLEQSLKDLITTKKETVRKIETSKQTAIQHISVSDRHWPKELDPTLQALFNKWKPKYAEMMNITARIYDVALAGQTDPAMKEEAGRMAHRILDLDDMCDDIYKQRDHYLKHKKLPDDKKPMELVVDPKKIPLALSNAERYVRQYKNKLKHKPDDVKAAEMLRKYEWAVKEYKKQLNLD